MLRSPHTQNPWSTCSFSQSQGTSVPKCRVTGSSLQSWLWSGVTSTGCSSVHGAHRTVRSARGPQGGRDPESQWVCGTSGELEEGRTPHRDPGAWGPELSQGLWEDGRGGSDRRLVAQGACVWRGCLPGGHRVLARPLPPSRVSEHERQEPSLWPPPRQGCTSIRSPWGFRLDPFPPIQWMFEGTCAFGSSDFVGETEGKETEGKLLMLKPPGAMGCPPRHGHLVR